MINRQRCWLMPQNIRVFGKGTGNFKLSDAPDFRAHAPKAGMGAMNRSS